MRLPPLLKNTYLCTGTICVAVCIISGAYLSTHAAQGKHISAVSISSPRSSRYGTIVPACGSSCNSVACSSCNDCGGCTNGVTACDGVTCGAAAPGNPSGYGNSCQSGANDCGQRSSGNIGCNGCNAGTPANPSGYGNSCQSGANDCGQRNSGSIQCNGSCNAQMPSDPSWYNQYCVSGANECGLRNSGRVQCNKSCSAGDPSNTQCAPPTIAACQQGTNSTMPTVVVSQGSAATLCWSATPANTCTVVGNNNSFSQTTNGGSSITTPPVTGMTLYTITCRTQGSHGVGPSTSIVIRVIPNPQFREL